MCILIAGYISDNNRLKNRLHIFHYRSLAALVPPQPQPDDLKMWGKFGLSIALRAELWRSDQGPAS
jgi:hypothetical protein